MEGFTVSFINTDGLVLIGPGSEWLWTAFSGLALVVTFLAIYRQLHLERGAAAIEQMDRLSREWRSERIARASLAVAEALEAGTAPDALPSSAVAELGEFWEKVGYLVRSGHVDPRLVHELMTWRVQLWWTWLRPLIVTIRDRDQNPLGWSEFEWLAGAMARLDAKLGVRMPSDLAAERPRMIAGLRASIAAEEALRTVPVRIVATPVEVTTVRPHDDDGQESTAPGDVAPAVA